MLITNKGQMLNYYKIKNYAASKLKTNIKLLKNNPNVKLFIADK